MAENLAEIIKRIRELKAGAFRPEPRSFYVNALLTNADALLEAAEFGLKCQEFFREKASKVERLCAACHWRGEPPEYKCLADFDCYIAREVEEAGLWPEGE